MLWQVKRELKLLYWSGSGVQLLWLLNVLCKDILIGYQFSISSKMCPNQLLSKLDFLLYIES